MSDALVINEIYLSLQGESTFAGLPCIFVRLTACNLRCSYCDTAYAFTEGRRMPLAEIRATIEELAKPFAGAHSASPGARPPSGAATRGDQRAAVESGSEQASKVVEVENGGPWSKADRTSVLPGRLPLIELTGGEPLLQPNSIWLMKVLCDDGFTVLLETSGAHDIAPVDPRVHRIMDLKCPSSGEVLRNRWDNLRHLKPSDEIKFVIGTVEDYDWSKQQLTAHNLAARCPLLFSWVAPLTVAQQHKSLQPVPAGQTPLSRLELVERIIADALPVRFQVQMHKVIWSPETRGV